MKDRKILIDVNVYIVPPLEELHFILQLEGFTLFFYLFNLCNIDGNTRALSLQPLCEVWKV